MKVLNATNFQEMVPAKLPSASQHHDAYSIKTHTLSAFESEGFRYFLSCINLQNLSQDRRPDSYARLVEAATDPPMYWRPRRRFGNKPYPRLPKDLLLPRRNAVSLAEMKSWSHLEIPSARVLATPLTYFARKHHPLRISRQPVIRITAPDRGSRPPRHRYLNVHQNYCPPA